MQQNLNTLILIPVQSAAKMSAVFVLCFYFFSLTNRNWSLKWNHEIRIFEFYVPSPKNIHWLQWLNKIRFQIVWLQIKIWNILTKNSSDTKRKRKKNIFYKRWPKKIFKPIFIVETLCSIKKKKKKYISATISFTPFANQKVS